MYDAIIFSFDGTLVDSRQHHIDAYLEAIKEYKNVESKTELKYYNIILKKHFDFGIEYVLKTFLYLGDIQIREIRKIKNQKINYEQIKLKTDIIEKFKDHKNLFIISNARNDTITNIMDANKKLITLFREIITPDLFYDIKKKPDPEMGLFLTRKYFLNPTNCVYIGDSDVDKMFAHNCEFNFKFVDYI